MTSEPYAFADITGLLYPRSVAVIGASDRSGNLGGDTVERLIRFKFPGKVFAVNPSGGTARGLKCYPTIADLPEAPEAVVMCIPGGAILDTVRQCAEIGTKNGVAFAGGFAEAGGDGIAAQKQLADYCRAVDFKLCGPNCVGILNAATPATLTFATGLDEIDSLRTGPIAIVTQSGGIGTAFFFAMQEAGFGVRHLISAGNEAVVSVADYVYGLACEDGTQVIALYLENVSDGPKLVRALEEARDRGKPVVMIKAGASGAAAAAAAAHTGALVGEDRVFDAILQELCVIRVRSIEEMIDVCKVLSSTPGAKVPRGRGVGVVTFGGGSGVLAADQCADQGLNVPPLGKTEVERIRPLLISVASAANPMDLTPSTAFRTENLTRLPEAMAIAAAQPDIDSMLFIVGSMPSRKKEISELFINFWETSPKLICMSWPAPPKGTVEALAERGIASFEEPARAIRVLARLSAYGEARERPRRSGMLAPPPVDWDAHIPSDSVIPEDRCYAILGEAGLPVAPGGLAKNAEAAVRIAGELGFPVVMKGITPKITHRAAAGLVAIDLRTPSEVTATFDAFAARAEKRGVTLDGVYVQKLVRGGAELFVSAFRDPVFGPMISCGSGGGLTERLNDVVTARAPVDAAVAGAMIARTRLSAFARDADGALDATAPAAFIAGLSQLAAAAPWRRFTFEVNPVKWTRSGAFAVDGLAIVEAP